MEKKSNTVNVSLCHNEPLDLMNQSLGSFSYVGFNEHIDAAN